MNTFEELEKRGLVKQTTNAEKIRHLLNNEKITFYIGFDPTADSLHVGHLLQLITAKRLVDAGHRFIALIGGATALIGDPSGKSDMRKMLDHSQIECNSILIKSQIKKLVDPFKVINNLKFHAGSNWLHALRDIGPFFSVNAMLKAECFKSRMEHGLSFLEFNYMILQAKDFHILNIPSGDNCLLQVGGDDQWSNILAGIDLIHKKEKREAFGLTLPLLVNSDGTKMGKTERGAVWLDKEKTSVFDFFQFWRNIPDDRLETCIQLLTDMSWNQMSGLDVNAKKKVLAMHLTTLVHGQDAAEQALEQAEALFESRDFSSMEITSIEKGVQLLDLLVRVGFAKSRTDARNLISNRGIAINDQVITDPTLVINEQFGKELIVRKGKKNFGRFCIKD